MTTRSTLKDLRPAPRRARDFVKCTDPECYHNKYQRNANNNRRRFGYTEFPVVPHCHPVF